MRREDIPPLLYQAGDRLPEPDLADAAWAEGIATRRRQRRSIVVGVVVVVLVAIIAAIGFAVGSGDKAEIVPPDVPPTNPPGYVQPAGQIAGINYWMAPPSGSERFLNRLETPLGDRLQLPDRVRPLSEQPIDLIAAVVLARNGGVYEPLLLGSDSSWSHANVQLVPIATGSPLSPGAISPNGRIAAFPQPGQLVTVDSATAEITRYTLPTQDIRSVSWLGDAERVLVGGPGVAYRVLVGEGGYGEEPVAAISGATDPEAITAPFRLDTGAVLRYLVSGEWMEDSTLRLPVRRWVGQTFSSLGTAARLFIANDLVQVPSRFSPPQVVAAISTLQTMPSHLLVLGDPSTAPVSPIGAGDRVELRQAGCCAVLGWYDDNTVLLEVQGWVLAWDLNLGSVRRVTELAVDGVAVGPGIRP